MSITIDANKRSRDAKASEILALAIVRKRSSTQAKNPAGDDGNTYLKHKNIIDLGEVKAYLDCTIKTIQFRNYSR